MIKQNYQILCDQTIKDVCKDQRRPSLLLHACCAPCSSYVLEYLSQYFEITLFFYNPNIHPEEEYRFRERELERLVREMTLCDQVKIISAQYRPEEFDRIAKGAEHLPEGGSRCAACYRLRLRASAEAASEGGFDFYTTTLSISPYKNAEWLNTIGEEEGSRAGVRWLFSDFKKKNGYKRSCELSAQHGLYRQDFCGCVYSKQAKNQK